MRWRNFSGIAPQGYDLAEIDGRMQSGNGGGAHERRGGATVARHAKAGLRRDDTRFIRVCDANWGNSGRSRLTMKPSPPKVIFFDAAGTLMFLPRPVGAHYAEVASACGLRLDAAALDRGFHQAWKAMPPRAAIKFLGPLEISDPRVRRSQSRRHFALRDFDGKKRRPLHEIVQIGYDLRIIAESLVTK